MTTPRDELRSFIVDCVVELRVGVYDFERKKPQKVMINVETVTRNPRAFTDPNSNDLSWVIDYDPIRNFICQQLPQMPHATVLEYFADLIIARCWQNPIIHEVRVRMEKVGVYPEARSAGIEIRRFREVEE